MRGARPHLLLFALSTFDLCIDGFRVQFQHKHAQPLLERRLSGFRGRNHLPMPRVRLRGFDQPSTTICCKRQDVWEAGNIVVDRADAAANRTEQGGSRVAQESPPPSAWKLLNENYAGELSSVCNSYAHSIFLRAFHSYAVFAIPTHICVCLLMIARVRTQEPNATLVEITREVLPSSFYNHSSPGSLLWGYADVSFASDVSCSIALLQGGCC